MTDVRLLARRVDALVLAFRVDFTDTMIAHLRERQAVAQEHGKADLEISCADDDGRSYLFELKRTRAIDKFYFESGDVRCVIDLQAAPPGEPKRRPTNNPYVPGTREQEMRDAGIAPAQFGWTLEVTARASWLAANELDGAIAAIVKLAGLFGDVHAERLRRFDLCADFAGWRLDPIDADSWVKPRRAKLASYIPDIAHEETDDADELEAQGGKVSARAYRDKRGRVTGFTVGAGGALSMRCYDKRAELRLPQSEHKRDFEHQIWQAAPGVEWTPEDERPVSRLEFQLRGEALDEMELRDPRTLASKIDRVWAYCVERWVRLVQPETATRLSRCLLDPRWVAATAVLFYHRAAPITRLRRRGAASLAQGLGSMLSLLGQLGQLGPIAAELRSYGKECDVAERVKPELRQGMVESLLAELCEGFRRVAVAEIGKGQKAKSLERLIVAVRAAEARFAPLPDNLTQS